ncbi:MAG TPA: hypothetical protein VJV22_13665 [Acidobacteriaceae bacterium]|nr:hypothetical protein [Acidobacteriaceae bacterium]
MRMAWVTVCLLAGPAALGQVPGLASPDAQDEGLPRVVEPGTSLFLTQHAGQYGWPMQSQPRAFSFAGPKAMPPVAKMEPIPTQWPNAKMEPIPTRWPNLQVVPLGTQPAAVALPALPQQK